MDLALDRIDQLICAGLSAPVATQVAICELGLAAVALADDVGTTLSGQMAAALIDAVTYEAVRRHCARPEWAGAWDRIAVWSGGAVRQRCLDLARLSRHERLRIVS